MKRKSILIVEDSIEQLCRYRDLAQTDFDVSIATTLEEAKVALDRDRIDILLTDIHLTDSHNQSSYEGFQLIEYSVENFPEILVIAMSADPKLETYNKSYSLGARCFLKKPIINQAEISIAIEQVEQSRVFERLAKSASKNSKANDKCQDGLVLDEKTRKTVAAVARVRDIPVVIYGETGTGKEEVAKLVHKRRVEAEGPIPFVAVNCANLEGSTALSTLFGHKKGSFTGAEETTVGLVGEADGGILFLDEIHRLNEECQAQLLRVLNDGTYQRFGDTKQLTSNFQVLVASTKDLDDMVDEGNFLMDLRSRITGVDIELLPLRERLEDLDLLVPLYFAQQGIEVLREEIKNLIDRCRSYHWQGNIRQLHNVLKSLQTMSVMNEEPILAENLPEFKTMFAPRSVDTSESRENSASTENDADGQSLKELMNSYEKSILRKYLSKHTKISDVIQALGVSRSSLDAKRRKFNI